MAGGTKEDEKNERVIRRLLKISENKRCINCNSLGPQYVCTTFWTFVCTNCSGIHREFTHRVKSISMAKFTSEEVNALQEGGNQRAKDIYFKGLDQERQPGFDSSNLEGLRNFIRQVYVNKRYTGEKIDDKTPRGQMGDKNDYNETRSSGGSRSPPYEDAYNRRSSRRSNTGGKSNKSPSRPEFVNDWSRQDRFGSARKSEEGIHSPEQVKGMGSSSPPVVRPVSEILGDNIVPLRVGEPPKPHVNTNADASKYTKGAPTSNSLTSTNENLPEVKLETAVISLIDFDADPEPPAPAVAVHALQSRPAAQPANDDWAFFDAASTGPSVIVSQSPPNGNTVDSLLSQLAMPSSMPVQTSSLASEPLASMDITNVHQQSPSLLPVHLGHSTSQNFVPPSSEPPWNMTFASNVQREASPLPLEGLQFSGRSELSADLFAVNYPSYNAAESGWQVDPPHGMHFGMQQYNNNVQPFQNLNFPQPAKSMNPFDFSSEPPSNTQTETLFPSMASLQGAVSNILPPLDMIPSQGLHNPSSLPPQVSGLASAMPPRYISPQMPGSMPPSNVSSIGNMDTSYGTQQTSHLIGIPFAAAVPTFPSGGNPFG